MGDAADEIPDGFTVSSDWASACGCCDLDNDDLCQKHWPGMCLRDDACAESVEGDKRIGLEGLTWRKLEKQGRPDGEWTAPFPSNPFDLR